MKRVLVTVLGSLLAIGIVYAGEYHNGDLLRCADCHTMHQSQQHDYDGTNNPQDFTNPTTEVYLLKEKVADLCLTCHDSATTPQDAPDVVGNDTSLAGPWAAGGDTPTYRSAGALNKDGVTVDTNYSDWMGHSLGSTDTAPGGTFANAEGLTCTDCHNPHGWPADNTDVGGTLIASTYRNLVNNTFGGVSISYQLNTTNDTGKDVWINSAPGTNSYERNSINLNEPWEATGQGGSGMGSFCKGCHTDFHGEPGDGTTVGGTELNVGLGDWEKFIRHPTAGVDIGELGGGHSSLTQWQSTLFRVRAMAPTGDWGSRGVALTGTVGDDHTPTCTTCHMAHGNQKTFGLIMARGTAEFGEDGDAAGVMQDLCRQCHVQGN